MLADRIDLGDRCTRTQERLGYHLLVVQGQTGSRKREQSRAAARHEEDELIVGTQAVSQGKDTACCLLTYRVRDRVTCLDDINSATGCPVMVAGEDKTLERSRPCSLERTCHRSRGFPGTYQHRAPADRCRNSLRDRLTGVRCSKCGVEQSS